MAEADERERNAARGREALQQITTCLFGDDFKTVQSPAFPTTPAFITYNSGVTLSLIPVGLYALGLWSAPETIVCCAAGTPSDTTFFSLAKRCFRKSGGTIIVERSSPEDAEFELNIASVPVHIKYHQNPLMARWTELEDPSFVEDLLEKLPRESRRRFFEIETTNRLACKLRESHSSFAYWVAREWALQNGVISCVLTGMTGLELLVLTLDAVNSPGSDVPSQFLLKLCQKSFDAGKLSRRATDLGLRRVRLTENQIAILQKAQAKTFRQLSSNSSEASLETWRHFLSSFERYIKIDVSFWSASTVKRSRFLHAVEHAISRLITKCTKQYSQIFLHAWPAPFVPCRDLESKDWQSYSASQDYEASYFIGCGSRKQRTPPNYLSLPDSDSTVAWFEKGLEDSKWTDATSSYTNVQLVENVDATQWSPDLTERAPIPEEKRRDDSSDDEDERPQFQSVEDHPVSTKAKSPQKVSKPEYDVYDSLPYSSSRPLRPALDVLHRIQHDPNMDSNDFIIGYLDRHIGLQEMPLEWWVSKDATSEEFIPQSRIRYFKRKSDDNVVWDREERKDLVYGSGRVT